MDALLLTKQLYIIICGPFLFMLYSYMVAFALYFAPCHCAHCAHCAHWNALSVPHTRVRPSTQIHFAYFSYLFPSKKLANNSLNYTDVKIHNDCGCGRNCVCSFADAGGRRTAQGWWVHTIRPSVTNFNFDQIQIILITSLSFSLSLPLSQPTSIKQCRLLADLSCSTTNQSGPL